jgi:hypothetical protein
MLRGTSFTESIKVKLDLGTAQVLEGKMHLTCLYISPEPPAKNGPFLVFAPSQNRDNKNIHKSFLKCRHND